MRGTIKRTVEDRGFGFIVGEDSRQYFFHRSALQTGTSFGDLEEGRRVRRTWRCSRRSPADHRNRLALTLMLVTINAIRTPARPNPSGPGFLSFYC